MEDRQGILNETYQKHKNLIYQIVWRFKDKNGGDFEELLAEANLLFVLSIESYKEGKGAYNTWLHHVIRTGLQDFKRFINQETCVKGKYESKIRSAESLQQTKKVHDGFCLVELLEDVGEDAKIIMELVYEPTQALQQLALKNKLTQRTRKTIELFLHNNLGWQKKRIKRSFKEIQERLYAISA